MRGDQQAISESAQRLMNDPVLNAALEAMEREVLQEIDKFRGDSAIKALNLVLRLQKARDVKRKLFLTVQTAKMNQELASNE